MYHKPEIRKKIFEYANKEHTQRMYVLIRFLYDVAGRIQDASEIKVKEFRAMEELKDGINVYYSLNLQALKSKPRSVVVTKEVQEIIHDYSKDFEENDFLFRKTKKQTTEGLRKNLIYFFTTASAVAAGCPKGFGSHDMRRTRA